MPSGIDQSWGFANPQQAKAAGVQVVSMYLSHDTSKNMTAADVKAYHAVGIGMLFNWESDAGRPLLGAAAGANDGHDASVLASQIIKQVGYSPSGRLVLYFSCDRDVNSSQFGTIDGYYSAAKVQCAHNGFGIGVYGEASLVHHLSAAGITDAEWQTYAWSGGVLDPATDFYQYQNGQNLGGASVDFDKVIHAGVLGAFWPPHVTPPAPPTPKPTPIEEIDMSNTFCYGITAGTLPPGYGNGNCFVKEPGAAPMGPMSGQGIVNIAKGIGQPGVVSLATLPLINYDDHVKLGGK